MLEKTVSDPQSAARSSASQSDPSDDAKISYPGFGKMFLVWTGIGALTTVRYSLLFPSKQEMWWLPALLGCTACYYPWIALTPAVFRIESRYPLGAGRWVRNLALLAMISVPFCLLASP